MAFEILTGSLTSHDITMNAVSVKQAYAQLSVDINAQPIDITTFASTNYVEELKGRIQAGVQMIGYTCVGTAWTNPLVWVTDPASTPFVGLAKTGASLAFNLNVFGDSMSLTAALNSGRVTTGRSTGSITAVWPAT